MGALVLLLVFAVVFSVGVAVIIVAVLALRASRRPVPPPRDRNDPSQDW
ncbi:hypothetical protein [Microbispora sp. NPDC049633]